MKVTYLSHHGDDLLVANAARASFDKQSTAFCAADERLLAFLARGLTADAYDNVLELLAAAKDKTEVKAVLPLLQKEKHFAPFCHPHLTVRVTAPLAIARQMWKSHIGGYMTEGIRGDGWSETSLRYVEANEAYMPDVVRKQAANVKQGSSKETIPTPGYYSSAVGASLFAYEELLKDGVCREQARMVLPAATMTTWVWTGSLLFFARVCRLRLEEHAQLEAQELTQQLAAIVKELWPVSYKYLVEEA